MNKRARKFIKSRDTSTPTPYYLSGKLTNIRDIGTFPSTIKKLDEEGKVESTHILSAITANFVYYLNKEADDEDGTVMVNRKIQLISDNYFGYNDLCELVGSNTSLLWISREVKVWQREQYIQPHLLTADVKKWLNNFDTETLTKKQKQVYVAFRDNGPVRYNKAEALMAVLSNTDQLPDIILQPQKQIGNG